MGCSHQPCRLATPSYGAPGIRTRPAVIPPHRFSRPAPCRSANAPHRTPSRRLDSNQRSPASEAGGGSRLPPTSLRLTPPVGSETTSPRLEGGGSLALTF